VAGRDGGALVSVPAALPTPVRSLRGATINPFAHAGLAAELWRCILLAAGDGALLLAGYAWVTQGAARLIAPLLVASMWLLIGPVVYRTRAGSQVHLARSTVEELPFIAQWSLGAAAAVDLVGQQLTVASGAALVGTLFVATSLVHKGVAVAFRRHGVSERVLVVADERSYGSFLRKLELERTLQGEVVGIVEPPPGRRRTATKQLADATRRAIDELGAERIVVAADDLSRDQLRAITNVGLDARKKISVLPTMGGAIGSRARLRHVGDLPMLEFDCRPMSRIEVAIKRLMDLVLSAGMLLVTLPLFVVIAAAIRLDDHGPVFFRQTRGARWGAPFTMLKFRTMGVDAEQRLDELLDLERLADPMFKLKEDPRVTRVGRFLRRTSLDELPQLINVLTGTMSIVGPRPEDYRLVQRYDADALAVRCGMKPGITGPMQVHGRGDLTFAERIAVEREYLENYTVTNDLRILAMTVASLLFGSGGAY
jgi:exopolysaccharide biosynthesis polyprenyl glycosylphosphotransferase